MLKSDYIIREHENTLLIQGYICIKTDSVGTQTWADMQETGVDIYHHTENYGLYTDELSLGLTEAEEAGAKYFTIHHPDISETLTTTWVSKAIAYARTKK
jgi:hypothetical protein